MSGQGDIFMQGVELMIFGVSAVFVFLSLLVLVTSLTSRFMSRFFPEAVAPRPATSAALRSPADPAPGELVAVITAAIHQHRKQRH
ncbi:MAG: OadG family protein [Haliea sp.]|uniref:OadG family protein n=1 Tax=Haliea sp. TaxID=1932666 RepID=UPI0032EFE8AF